MPRVTAAITTFNRAGLLRRAILSVLSQTFRDLELLVLDNSSTDETGDVVERARSLDARVRHVSHPPMTISAARNIGLKEASGEFIAYLDDDDEWLPEKTARQVARFEQVADEVALVYGGFVRLDARGREFGTHPPVLRGRVLDALLWQRDAFTGSASNPMLRATAVQALGGYAEDITTSEDWEFYLRLAERYDVEYVPDVVVRIRSHGGARLGDRIQEAGLVEERVLARYARTMTRPMRSYYLQKIGGKSCRAGAVREGRARIVESIRTHPLNTLAYAQYALSFFGSGAYRQIHGWYKRLRSHV